jgi:hypothetical protein
MRTTTRTTPTLSEATRRGQHRRSDRWTRAPFGNRIELRFASPRPLWPLGRPQDTATRPNPAYKRAGSPIRV